ncbi:hypothetical protein UVI_02032480 [Ustilaginoidea virens]|uniref:non-specific serine/threonine protein kinase n=1 Tax=Ustilaginoidea virens TaxID=1159556 RepID=A0A1B5KUA1_USTVR|nr:hypothetical protein UVI_02032480 [Ustilaginoidea virens]
MADAKVLKARSPLAEATNRINAVAPTVDQQMNKVRYNQSDILHTRTTNAARVRADTRQAAVSQQVLTTNPHPAPQTLEDDKRMSQASYASTSSSRSRKNYKTHIGPWQLGRTLGKGSSARVRLCRHNITNQLAAVKIVNRRMAYLVHDNSMAALSKWDSSLPDTVNGEMRVPMAIEREVAILKLIEHPNIMRLYDIWENRSEIYLILEYIDQGDLFTFINSRGRLPEELAIFFFRQMMSAISYCHSFNVCHRDLKPENILITADYQIKIADFGMAALHQTATHQLATACGSPHYAAPELLKNRQYRGDRADIWSMGVILFAMLSATLPFDDPDLRLMMSKTKKGQYEMPKFLSPEAEDLIRRMLQVNPDRRITMKEIWRHPLVQKYSYLDDFGDNSGQLPDTRKGFQYAPVPRADIDPQLLRQLRSMWHMFSEQDLTNKLTCREPNDQKAFYWLLYNYRNKQLEDFKPELAHSMSDYHHLKPAIWKRRISTCQFEQTRANGNGRSISRFTVISNAAETETDDCDGYPGGKGFQKCDSQVSQAKVTVHRDGQVVSSTTTTQANNRMRNGSNSRRMRANSTMASLTSRPQSSRGSLASLRSSRQENAQIRVPSLRHKRGVDFSHLRKRSGSAGPGQRAIAGRTSSGVASGKAPAGQQSPAAPSRSPSPGTMTVTDGTIPKAIGAPESRGSAQENGASSLFNEELRHFSNNIAKDCDAAFKSSIIIEDSECDSSMADGERKRESDPLSLSLDSPATTLPPVTEASAASWLSRPLPPLPKKSGLQPRPRASVKASAGPNRVDQEVDVEASIEEASRVTLLLPRKADRRIVSAPAYSQPSRKLSTLPSINENAGIHGDGSRVVSAPPHSVMRRVNVGNPGVEYLSKVENSIRIVNSPTSAIPIGSVNAPVTREKSGEDASGSALHRQPADGVNVDEDDACDVNRGPKKKKSSWFKRVSRIETIAGGELRRASASNEAKQQSGCGDDSGLQTRKRNFTFPFWKGSKGSESGMIIEGSLNLA